VSDAAQRKLAPAAERTLLAERGRFLDFLHHRVGSRELAEEILQEAYAKALERGGQLRDDESAVAWFFRILRNAVVERARREAASARALERLAQELETAASPGDEAQGAVCACVRGVLSTLEPSYRDAVSAVDVDGHELRAFAATAGITPNNAAVRLHRGRRALGERLRATCGACAEHGCVDCTCTHVT
jgi:RNA polymerase sigma-70 factor (ECF subfamily)